MESPGRNAPCPCGSGKKYKACCLRSRALPDGSGREAQIAPDRGVLQPVAPPVKKVTEVTALPRTREMDGEALAAIRCAMQELHLRLAREHGLVVRQRKHTHSKWNSRVEFEVAVEREDGIVMDGLAESFLERCNDYGLLPDDLGRPFRCDERTFRITGLRPRAKIPILCEQLAPEPTENVEYRFEPSAVRHYLHECPGQTGAAHRH